MGRGQREEDRPRKVFESDSDDLLLLCRIRKRVCSSHSLMMEFKAAKVLLSTSRMP